MRQSKYSVWVCFYSYTKKGTAECSSFFGGERGIRTPGTVTRTTV